MRCAVFLANIKNRWSSEADTSSGALLYYARHHPLPMKLILASASARRAEILHDAGLSFAVLTSAVDETPMPGEAPADLVQRLADAKAELVSARAVAPAIIIA